MRREELSREILDEVGVGSGSFRGEAMPIPYFDLE